MDYGTMAILRAAIPRQETITVYLQEERAWNLPLTLPFGTYCGSSLQYVGGGLGSYETLLNV